MVTKPRKSVKKPVKPTKNEVFQRVVESGGVDPATVDPRRILAGIASDPDAPAGARVMACKIMMTAKGEPTPGAEDEGIGDELSRRALQLLSTGKAN